jgi:hypothetical protein
VSPLGRSSQRLVGVLNAAFAQGLLSEQTHSYRLGLLFQSGLVDQRRLVGDLRLRGAVSTTNGAVDAWRALVASARELAGRARGDAPYLLALHGLGNDRVLVGRHPRCDIVIDGSNVSRRHAELLFRDGVWVIRDLGSTNGTTVNGSPVGRSELRPGDIVGLADLLVQID